MEEILDIEQASKKNEGIDTLEKFMLDNLEPALEKLTHVHTPGLYGRKWEAKAGTLWVTRKHLIEHQFVILEGVVSVWIDGEETIYEAPYHGITKPGTRRVLYIWEDTTWMTFHPNPANLNEEEFVEIVTEKHDNKFFKEEDEMLLKEVRSKIEQKYLTA